MSLILEEPYKEREAIYLGQSKVQYTVGEAVKYIELQLCSTSLYSFLALGRKNKGKAMSHEFQTVCEVIHKEVSFFQQGLYFVSVCSNQMLLDTTN